MIRSANTASTPSTCPTAGLLAAYLNDALPEPEGAAIESHIQDCEHCQRCLESLTPYSLIGRTKPAWRSEYRPADDFMAELYAGVSAEIAAPLDDAALPEIPGYRVVRPIGSGGMGVVYEARDSRLDRTVALKVLHPSLGGESIRGRLRREAAALARLRHPNVIQIHEVGEAGGRAFLALEYVDGPNLNTAFATDPPAPRRAAAIVERLAKAIHAAHRAGIVHRDLKPSNILIDPEGEPKIADFGLAKLMDDAGEGVTLSGQLVGTPGFAAPEQVSTAGEGVTASVDIYALGALLYDLLTGRPPFRSDSTLETLLRVLRDPPVPPSQVNPRVPKDLETICLACLHKNPARRYATAEALAEDLRRYLDGRPVKARPISPLGRAVRWVRRHPAAAALVSLALFFMGALAAGSAWQWREAERRASVEHAARTDAELRAKAEAQARGVAEGRIAELAVDHGLNLCSIGSVGPGLMALADAVANADPGSDSVRVARLNLDAWQHHVAGRRHTLAHPDAVTSVAFSNDGRKVITGCMDGNARGFDAATGEPLGPALPHPAVFAAAFLPDGHSILTAGKDGTIHAWQFPAGSPLRQPVRHGSPIQAFALDPAGKAFATGGIDGMVRLWDAATGEPKLEPIEHGGPVLALAFSPDGRRLVTGSEDRKARIWDTQTGEAIGTPMGHAAPVDKVSAGPLGMSAAGSAWGFSSRLPLTVLGAGRQGGFTTTGTTSALTFDPNGKYMAIAVGEGDKPKGVSLYRIEGIQVNVRMLPFESVAKTLVASQSGRQLLVAGEGCHPVIWGEATERPVKIAFSETSDGPVALSQDGTQAATSRKDRRGQGWSVTLWDVPRCAEGELNLRQGAVDRIDMGPNGMALLSGGKRARLWNTATAKAVAPSWTAPPIVACTWGAKPLAWVATGSTLQGHDAATGDTATAPVEFQRAIRSVATSRDGRLAAVLTADEIVGVELATGAVISRIPSQEAVDAMDLSADGRILAFGRSDGAIQLWSMDDRQRIGELPGRESWVAKVAFSPDGTHLAVSSTDKSVAVWNVERRGTVGQPMTHSSTLLHTAWAADGSLLFTLDVVNMVRLWDARTGTQVGPPLPRLATAIAAGHDNRYLLTGDPTREVRSWKIPKAVTVPPEEIAGWMRRKLNP
jgi:WD40 repeat protein/predicted Ser/Thr protein kinase